MREKVNDTVGKEGNWVVERLDGPFVRVFRVRRNEDEGLYILIDEDDCLNFLRPIKPSSMGDVLKIDGFTKK